MRRIRSIFNIFILFLVVITVSFFLLYFYSTTNLESSLLKTGTLQAEYSGSQLTQKIKEIEIEADGILHSDTLRTLHLSLTDENYDAYRYVTAVNAMKDFLVGRQKSNAGMSSFFLYWPRQDRIVTSGTTVSVLEKEMLQNLTDNSWIFYKNQVYFVRCFTTKWDDADEEPYLLIQMDRDFLYSVCSLASGIQGAGAILADPEGNSLFHITEAEQLLMKELSKKKTSGVYRAVGRDYQVICTSPADNGMELIVYYPTNILRGPIHRLTWMTGGILSALLILGLVLIILYYRNILAQLSVLTEKLRQVQGGDLNTRIDTLPDNEFHYVFEQFNRMTDRTRELIDSLLKEQTLHNQAEMRQLQLQIHPHFLYNSLSYIVTVADRPDAVTKMAVHLSRYYRYSTRKKSVTTIGEEIEYARNYLAIMAMRKQIEYQIEEVPELKQKPVIPLILQPIIENAIEHAIEERENAHHIGVKIEQTEDNRIRFEVSDDGNGLTEEETDRLEQRLAKKERDENESVGLWNVNQRLINYYDKDAGLRFGRSLWGGLAVSFTVPLEENRHEGFDR